MMQIECILISDKIQAKSFKISLWRWSWCVVSWMTPQKEWGLWLKVTLQRLCPWFYTIYLVQHTHVYTDTHKIHIYFLWPYLQHMEVSGLGVESELQLPAYTIATATSDPSHACNLCCSSWHCWILGPLSEARDWTHILMNTTLGS